MLFVFVARSFSSVSDANDNLDASTSADAEKERDNKEESQENEEVKSDPGTPLQDEPGDDDISIIGDDEDDDILAAIDDFLEDREEKKEPEKVTGKNLSKKEKPKIKPKPIVFEKNNVPKQTGGKEGRTVASPTTSSKLVEKKAVNEKRSDRLTVESLVPPVVTRKPAVQKSRGNLPHKKEDT